MTTRYVAAGYVRSGYVEGDIVIIQGGMNFILSSTFTITHAVHLLRGNVDFDIDTVFNIRSLRDLNDTSLPSAERTYKIVGEDKIYQVTGENRKYDIVGEIRSLDIGE